MKILNRYKQLIGFIILGISIFFPLATNASRSPVGFETGKYAGDFVREINSGRVWYISNVNSRRYQVVEGDENVFAMLKQQSQIEAWYRIITAPEFSSDAKPVLKIGIRGLVYDENAPDLLWHIQKRAYLRQALRSNQDIFDYVKNAMEVKDDELQEYPIAYADFDYSIKEPSKVRAAAEIDNKSDQNKYINISLKEQRLRAYENGKLVKTFLISSGRWGYATPKGEHEVLLKAPVVRYQWSYGKDNPDNYDLGEVPYNLRIMPHIYIHYAYWHYNFGRPMSHGCINTSLKDAKWIFRWADENIPVTVE